MKLIKKILPAFMLFTGTIGFSQETAAPENYDQGFRLGFGLNAGAVTKEEFNFALGGDVRLQYDLSLDTSLTLTTGYTHLFGDDDIPDLGFIPVKAGFKAFIWRNQFYVMGEAGAGFAVTNDYNETTFIWSPSFGYANETIDLSLRYEAIQDFYDAGQIALRLAYGFKL